MKNFTLLAAVLLLPTGAAFPKDYTPAELAKYAREVLLTNSTTRDNLTMRLHDLASVAPCQDNITDARHALDEHRDSLKESISYNLCEMLRAQKKVNEFCSDAHFDLARTMLLSTSPSNADIASSKEESFQKCFTNIQNVSSREHLHNQGQVEEKACCKISQELRKLSNKLNS